MASGFTGQPALRPFPSRSHSSSRTIASYTPPASIQIVGKSGEGGGIAVLKVTKVGKLQKRHVALSPDNRTILVTSNKIRSVKGLIKLAMPKRESRESAARHIDISTIDRVQKGLQTRRFGLAKSQHSSLQEATHTEQFVQVPNCLSIVFRNTSAAAKSNEFETVDLVVPNKDDFDTLFSTIDDLVALYRYEGSRFDRDDLILEQQWISLDKYLSETISINDWVVICDRLNVPLKKGHIAALYKDYARDLEMEEGLSLAQTKVLLEHLRAESLNALGYHTSHDPCHRVWNEVYASDPVPYDDGEDEEPSISPVAFLSFARSEQRQFKATVEDSRDFIGLWPKSTNTGQNGKSIPPDRMTRSLFISYLLSDANDAMDPGAGEMGSDDMTKPLSAYWINTSHDTYLAKMGNSFSGVAPLDSEWPTDLVMYQNALHRGVRCLELDVWDGENEPVVSHSGDNGADPTKKSTNRDVLFSDVLISVRSFLEGNPYSFPIILSLENHCCRKNQLKMANYLRSILGTARMLYKPTEQDFQEDSSLPSPESLRGKVILKGKRPKVIKEGVQVMVDDYDDYLEREIEPKPFEDSHAKELTTPVLGFSSTGPIFATSKGEKHLSPEKLLAAANADADDAKKMAAKAEETAFQLKVEADAAEENASKLLQSAGLTEKDLRDRDDLNDERGDSYHYASQRRTSTKHEVKESPHRGRKSTEDDVGMEIELYEVVQPEEAPELVDLLKIPPGSKGREKVDQGLEVQQFFAKAVESAKEKYAKAEELAKEVTSEAVAAENVLLEKKQLLQSALNDLNDSREREAELGRAAAQAAGEARTKHEDAETARARVDTVRELVEKLKSSAASAETVVGTALAESNISEQRASQAESRAARAMSAAGKEKARADRESQKEEALEIDVEELRLKALAATEKARIARENMQKAAGTLEKVDMQVKLIESSPNYSQDGADDKFTQKLSSKLEEKLLLATKYKEAKTEYVKEETKRKRIQGLHDEKLQELTEQSELAIAARRQADRTAVHAEELAEHAEEEREAANLRHLAKKKAEDTVARTEEETSGMGAQLREAQRAADEAEEVAKESRVKAQELARHAAESQDHSSFIKNVEQRRREKEAAAKIYEAASAKKEDFDGKAADAMRRLEASTEVLTRAERETAAEVHRLNAEHQAEINASIAYRKALAARADADFAQAKSAELVKLAVEKASAARQATDFRDRMYSIQKIDVNLARATYIHSTSFFYWAKSLTLPASHMHSFSESAVRKFEFSGTDVLSQLARFNKTHLCRTFPSWKTRAKRETLNYNPMLPWAVGCQLTSMNFSSVDEHLLLCDGRFRQNGSSGYVLKPRHLYDLQTNFSSINAPDKLQRWNFRVLGGYNLPKPEAMTGKKGIGVGGGNNLSSITPFVRIAVFSGVPASTDVKSVYQTKMVESNGFNPIWNEEEGHTFDVASPSLAMVLFTVWDQGEGGIEDFIGASAIPVSCLREGYRSLPLFDSNHTRSGPYSYANLFIRVMKSA